MKVTEQRQHMIHGHPAISPSPLTSVSMGSWLFQWNRGLHFQHGQLKRLCQEWSMVSWHSSKLQLPCQRLQLKAVVAVPDRLLWSTCFQDQCFHPTKPRSCRLANQGKPHQDGLKLLIELPEQLLSPYLLDDRPGMQPYRTALRCYIDPSLHNRHGSNQWCDVRMSPKS